MEYSILQISSIIRKAIMLAIFSILPIGAEAKVINTEIEGTTQRQQVEEILADFQETLPHYYAELDNSETMVIVHLAKSFDNPEMKGYSRISGNICHVYILGNDYSGEVLAHEAGHILHIVRNPDYVNSDQSSRKGHSDNDPSGKLAHQFEKEYRAAKIEKRKADRLAKRESKKQNSI